MANVSHASLTGSNVHEPKGIETAASGQAYLANGAGSGAWTTLSGLSLTGMVAPFITPVVPSGWYELDGSTISSTTDSALYNTMTIQQTGTRVSGNAVISGLPSTANFKVGYYVFGTGITAGTTILTINSSTDITLSANATSSGSSLVIVSPWQLVSGGLVLPDTTTNGMYLRSRQSTTRVGYTMGSQNKPHTHGFGTSGDSLAGTVITSTTESATHTHSYSPSVSTANFITSGGATAQATPSYTNFGGSTNTGTESATHTHNITMPGHTHTGTTDSDTTGLVNEVRVETLVVMWCVKR